MPLGATSRTSAAITSPAAASAVAAGYAAGRLAHPGLALERSAFEAHAVRCAESRLKRQGEAKAPGALADALRAASAGDLFLATACVFGTAGAWDRFHEQHTERLRALAGSRGVSAVEAEQQVQDLLGDLATRALDPTRPPLLEQYDASGSLFGWLATCLLRRLSARARAAGRTKTLPDSDALESPRAPDPSGAAERADLEQRLRTVLRDAVDSLTSRERAALVLSSRDGWSGEETARILGVGAPRVSRLRAKATERIREAVLPIVRSPDSAGGPDPGTWAALRDAVSATLARVAILTGGRSLQGDRASPREGSDA